MLQMHQQVPVPVTNQNLEDYVVAVANRLAWKTIKTYLAGIKFILTISGQDVTLLFQRRLHYILRGVRRSQGQRFRRPRRIPITLSHLRHLITLAHTELPQADARCFTAAALLAFFGLLRVSEFTSPSPTFFDANWHLGRGDISFSPSRPLVVIRIKASKTDPFREGCSIRIAATGIPDMCPVRALIAYLSSDPCLTGPLFVLSNGQFLTRQHINAFLRRAFPLAVPGTIASHSFRIGGASRLCSLGVPDATIQIMGRWASDAFRRYLHISDTRIARLHFCMADPAHHQEIEAWDPDA